MTQNNTDGVSNATNVQNGGFTIIGDTRVLFSANKAGLRYTTNARKPETPVATVLKVKTERGESLMVGDVDMPLGDETVLKEMKESNDTFDTTCSGVPVIAVEKCGMLTIEDITGAKTHSNRKGINGTHAQYFDQNSLNSIANTKFKIGDAPKI